MVASAIAGLAYWGGRMSPSGLEIEIGNVALASLADASCFTASRILNQLAKFRHFAI
jgi:hypothetical protein